MKTKNEILWDCGMDVDVENSWTLDIIYNAMEKYAQQFKELNQAEVIKSVCTCENAEKEKHSSIPVYCHNCNAYVQTDL